MKLFLGLLILVMSLTGCSGLMKDDSTSAVLAVTCIIVCRVIYYENALDVERDHRKPVTAEP